MNAQTVESTLGMGLCSEIKQNVRNVRTEASVDIRVGMKHLGGTDPNSSECWHPQQANTCRIDWWVSYWKLQHDLDRETRRKAQRKLLKIRPIQSITITKAIEQSWDLYRETTATKQCDYKLSSARARVGLSSISITINLRSTVDSLSTPFFHQITPLTSVVSFSDIQHPPRNDCDGPSRVQVP
jgi:hypothetical protein